MGRHILCVAISVREVICKEWIHSRWWRDKLQPEVNLRRKSPFVSINNEGEVVVGSGKEADDPNIEDVEGRQEIVQIEEFLESNGGDFEMGSMLDSDDIAIMDGNGAKLTKKTPKERRNELVNRFYHLVQKIGFGPGSIDVMDDLDACLDEWEGKRLKETNGMGLSANIRTFGAPPTHA